LTQKVIDRHLIKDGLYARITAGNRRHFAPENPSDNNAEEQVMKCKIIDKIFIVFIFAGLAQAQDLNRVLTSLAHVQNLNRVVPIGYQNPFLVSGQFITTLYYYSNSNRTESPFDGDKSIYVDREYSVRWAGYLGLTNSLTLSTKLFVYPGQKIYWGEGVSNEKNTKKPNLNPQVTLSYRPLNDLEIFGSINYRRSETLFSPYTYQTMVPVGIDPETGVVVYGPSKVTVGAAPQLEQKLTVVKVGFTYSGCLW
jgi:hypothetical protein